MSTSGVHRSWVDIEVWCGLCFWEGWTEGCEDLEDMTFTWTCPGCGHEHLEVANDQDH